MSSKKLQADLDRSMSAIKALAEEFDKLAERVKELEKNNGRKPTKSSR